jgi:pyruvate carboxylase subunit B
MMALPPGCTGAHDPDFYEGMVRQIMDADVEFDTICFKDASGTATPAVVYETIKRARKLLGPDMPIRMHTHETAGTSVLVYKSALDAGADGIDLSMRPMSGGTGQPDILTMWHALRGTEYDLQIDPDKVREAEAVFKDCMKEYFMPPEATAVEPIIPWSPMPGGALTANTQMLRDNGLMDKYPEIIDKMKDTVTRGGFGTSVTPVSQFYFQQAFNNVMFGDWEKIAEGYGKMVLGYFGKTPVEPDPEIVKLASEQLKLEPTTRDPRAINDEDPKKGLEVAKKNLEAAGVTDLSEENVFIAATCADKGIQFLQGKYTIGVRKDAGAPVAAPAADGPVACKVNLNGKDYNVTLDGDKAVVNGKPFDFSVSEGTVEEAGAAPAEAGSGTMITAQMPGNVIRLEVALGDVVEEGQPLMVIEAMKMETEIKSKATGTVGSILVDAGDKIVAGQDLVEIV